MTSKIVMLCAMLFAMQPAFAQSKGYEDSLSTALNRLVTTLPENCKSIRGKLMPNSEASYYSTVTIPRTIDGRIEIDTSQYAGFPLVFMCYVPAGNDRKKAILMQKEIGKSIAATVITYQGKKYKILFLDKESKEGNEPDYQYNIENAPPELSAAKFYVRLDDAIGKKYKFHLTMGMYVKSK